LKTSEIAEYIAQRNPRLFIGTNRPFLPLCPQVRTPREVGWVAFNLIRCMEDQQQTVFAFNEKIGAFGFFPEITFDFADFEAEGWAKVEFDGYGELESWKEVAK
jgi:hypothetical protein